MMTTRRLTGTLGVLISLTVALTQSATAAHAAGPDGERLYLMYCASCHGISGKGDGPDAAIFSESPRNLRTGFLNKYGTGTLVQRVRDGRALPLELDIPALRARAKEVEALVAYLQRMPSVDWPRAIDGRDVYAHRCAVCHGTHGQPGKTLPAGVRKPRDLSDPAVQRSLDEKELITLVRHGREGMPALTPRVPEADAAPLAAFVRLLSPGFTLYDRYCVNCHGVDGRPVGSIGEVMRLPKVVFDRGFFLRRDAEQLRAEAWHMAAEQKPRMPHYRWTLDEDQATSIVEFLKRGE